jgi:hypothetical protein
MYVILTGMSRQSATVSAWAEQGSAAVASLARTRYGARPARRAIDGQRIAPCLMASHSENVKFMQIVENISLALPRAVLPRRRRSIRQVLTRLGSGGICENRTLSGASHSREACPRESGPGNLLASLRKCAANGLESRLRGNDHGSRNVVIKSEIGSAYPLKMLKMEPDYLVCSGE